MLMPRSPQPLLTRVVNLFLDLSVGDRKVVLQTLAILEARIPSTVTTTASEVTSTAPVVRRRRRKAVQAETVAPKTRNGRRRKNPLVAVPEGDQLPPEPVYDPAEVEDEYADVVSK